VAPSPGAEHGTCCVAERGARERPLKLFVYGTLRYGQPGHALLRGAPLLAEVHTAARFTLVELGGYPALVEGGQTAIVGEIYEVEADILTELDRYEDVPEMYQRVSMRIAGHDVLVYALPTERAAGRPRLADGDWSRR
jgi:gamma-glutamylaminecyclotransferase